MNTSANSRIDSLYQHLVLDERLSVLLDRWRDNGTFDASLNRDLQFDDRKRLATTLGEVDRHNLLAILFTEGLFAQATAVRNLGAVLGVLYQWQEWSMTLVMAIGFEIEPPQAALLAELLKEVPHWPPGEYEPEDGTPRDASRHCASVASRFKGDLAKTWTMLLSLEAVTEWLSAELGGRDVLHPQPRKRLGELRAKLLDLRAIYRGSEGEPEFLPSEPDPTMLANLKTYVRVGDP